MYRLTETPDVILFVDDGVYIPADPANSDYQAYLAWVAANNAAEPYTPLPAAVPQSISMRQARLALMAAGQLAAVSAAIDALPTPQREAAQIEWEYATEVRRDNALLQALTPGLGLDAAELDALFVAAAAL